MFRGEFYATGKHVANYLLFALLLALVLESVIGVGVRFHWLSLTVIAAVAFAALAATATAESLDTAESNPPSPHRPTGSTVIAVLSVLLVAGAVLRVWALGAQSVWFDEAITVNAAMALLEHGRPTFPSGFTYWRAFPHTLVVAASMFLFGTGEAAVRLPSVVSGVVTIAATYWLGRSVGGRTVGLVAAVLVTFSTWETAWSRQARMYGLFQLAYTVAVILIVRVAEDGIDDRWDVLVLGVASILPAMIHQIGYVLAPVGAGALGLAVLDGNRNEWRTAGVLAVGTMAMLLTLVVVLFDATAVVLSSAATDVGYVLAYGRWFAAELRGYLFLGVVGSVLAFYRHRYRTATVLVLAVVPAVWMLSFYVELFATRYLHFGLPIVFVWAGLVIVYAADATVDGASSLVGSIGGGGVRHRLRDAGFGTASAKLFVAFALVAALAVGGGFTVTPQAEYELGLNAPQPDFQRAYDHLVEHRQAGDVIVAGWTAPGLYYGGGVDYWLAHDLTGTGDGYLVGGVDRYAGAEPIRTPAELRALVDRHERGWIVVDVIALRRWTGGDSSAIESIPGVNERLRIDDGRDGIRVYAWDVNGSKHANSTRLDVSRIRASRG